MNYRYPAILAILIVLIAMAVAGCTILNPGSPAATTTPGGATTAPSGATTAPSGSVLSKLSDALSMNQIHWFEYKTTTASGDGTMRIDFGVDYKGQKADKMSMTSAIKQQDVTMTSVIEVYTANGNSLGGHMQTKMGDQVVSDMDIQPTSGSTSSQGSNPFEKNSNAALTSLGVDTVTVPAGTYVATKYTVSGTDGSGTVWIAPNVPVPVKYAFGSGDAAMTMELNGWG